MEQEQKVIIDTMVAVLYAVAAISGALGGCATSCYYMTHDKHPRWTFAIAYTIMGVVFGILTYAGLAIYHRPETVDMLVVSSIAGGAAGALALGAANLTVRLILRRLGVEVAFTVRKAGEDRRDVDGQEEEVH